MFKYLMVELSSIEPQCQLAENKIFVYLVIIAVTPRVTPR